MTFQAFIDSIKAVLAIIKASIAANQSTINTALSTKADLVAGKIPASQLPAYVDDVLEFANFATLPATGVSGVIYIALDTNATYRWGGSSYVNLSSGNGSLVLGETSSTAYRGDRGKIAYDHSLLTTGNPHNVTFAQLGSKPTTISGFGITDAYTKTEIDTATFDFVTYYNGL